MNARTAKRLDITFWIIWAICSVIAVTPPLGWITVILLVLPPVLHFTTAALYGLSKGRNIFKEMKAYYNR